MHLSASSLSGNKVVNCQDEDLGTIEDLMINTTRGDVDYAVLSFGGVMGIGDKLFAIPMSAVSIDTENERCVVDIDKDRLKEAPGFDKDDWPNTADPKWQSHVNSFYSD